MSTPATATALETPPAPVHPELVCVSVPLPRVWVGYVFAVICLAMDITGWVSRDEELRIALLVISLPISLAAWIYWLFCLHRIHRVLALATGGKYPVGAREAVGLQLVPFLSWWWRFRWSNRIADFLNTNSNVRMKRIWPGIFLLLASFLGTASMLAQVSSLRILILFSVILYITHKLKAVLKFSDALPLDRKKQLDLAMTAGLGTAFGFVFVGALTQYFTKNIGELAKDAIGILVLSLAVAKFIEPLGEKVRVALKADLPHAQREHRPRLVQIAVIVLLIFSNFFHEILHATIQSNMDKIWQTFFVGLLVSGGITYFWVAGVRQAPAKKAAWFGLLSGTGIALFSAFVIGVALTATTPEGRATEALQTSSVAQAAFLPGHYPAVPFASLQSTFITGWPWPLLGFIGGLAIDRKWGKRGVRGVVYSILAVGLVIALLEWWFNSASTREALVIALADTAAIAGWSLGLLLHPVTSTVFGQPDPASVSHLA